MIKLTYKEINSVEFSEALNKLAQEKEFKDFQAMYNVARIYRQYRKEFSTAKDLYFKLMESYFERDENHKPIFNKEKNAYEIIEGKKEELQAKLDELMAVEIHINSNPLKFDDLGSVKLTPKQVTSLEPIFETSAFDK